MASDLLFLSGMVIEQLLQYVNEHPDAKDAIEGIQNYWLTGCSLSKSEEVQNILDLLVKREWLLISKSSVSPALYRLNKARVREVQFFLDRLSTREPVQGLRRLWS